MFQQGNMNNTPRPQGKHFQQFSSNISYTTLPFWPPIEKTVIKISKECLIVLSNSQNFSCFGLFGRDICLRSFA